MAELDNSDRKILQLYLARPDITAKEVSHEIRLSKPAVHKRIQKLKAQGVLSVETRVCDAAYATRYLVWLSINIEAITRHHQSSDHNYNSILGFMRFLRFELLASPGSERFAGRVLVEDVVVALGGGSHDILIRLAFADDEFALLFITEILNALPGVTHTESHRVFTVGQLATFYEHTAAKQSKSRKSRRVAPGEKGASSE